MHFPISTQKMKKTCENAKKHRILFSGRAKSTAARKDRLADSMQSDQFGISDVGILAAVGLQSWVNVYILSSGNRHREPAAATGNRQPAPAPGTGNRPPLSFRFLYGWMWFA